MILTVHVPPENPTLQLQENPLGVLFRTTHFPPFLQGLFGEHAEVWK